MKLKEPAIYSNCSCYFIFLYKENEWNIQRIYRFRIPSMFLLYTLSKTRKYKFCKVLKQCIVKIILKKICNQNINFTYVI